MGFEEEALAGLRGGLLVFCYQLLGSPFDAEDAVQATMERAWRSRQRFDPRIAALSTWVYRIARNVCFDQLRGAPARPLPRDLSDPGIDVGAPLVPAPEVPWLMPAPTRWWADSEPERAAVRSENIRLAVTAVLQALPPRQRGVFILRDVLGHSAAETAEVLDLSAAAVNSALQRARVAVRDRGSRPAPLRADTVEQYARAIERSDVSALAELVAADVLFEMPPVPRWSIGRETYTAFMAALFERDVVWTTRPLAANGQHGLLLWADEGSGPRPHTVQLFDGNERGAQIGHVLVYADPRLFSLFEDGADADR